MRRKASENETFILFMSSEGMSRRVPNAARVYTTKIPIESIPIGKEKVGERQFVGSNEN